MHLLIDVGNTAIKMALVKNQKIINQTTFNSNRMLNDQQIIKKLQQQGWLINNVQSVILCSVKPSWDIIFKNVSQLVKAEFFQIKVNINANDLTLNIDNPQTLGADLLMTSYGAWKKYPNQDLIIITFGTATTISLIKNNMFEGTIIMPGLKISAYALFEKAALLHEFNYQYSTKYIGKNTEEAINLGAVNGHLWGVKGLVNGIKKHLKKPLLLITGGNNFHYETFFDNYKLEPNLLFEGMMELIKIIL